MFLFETVGNPENYLKITAFMYLVFSIYNDLVL